MLGGPAQVERPAVHHEQRRSGVPVATTACSSSSCRPGSSSDDRDAASPIMFCHSPTTTTATSASRGELDRAGELGVVVEALGVRPARCRRTCRTSTGTCAARPADPRRVRRRATPSPSRGADALEHGDGLVEVEVEDPRPEGVAAGVGERAEHRDRVERGRRRAAAGRPRCAAAPPSARRRSAPPRGGPGRPAPRGRGPRRRTGRRAGRAAPWPRAPGAPRRRAPRRSTGPAASGLGQVREGRVGDRHLHVDAGGQRAGRRRRRGRRRTRGSRRLRTAFASLTTNRRTQVSRSTSVNSQRLPRGRNAVEVHVRRHDVAGARLDRRPERRQVDVPELVRRTRLTSS